MEKPEGFSEEVWRTFSVFKKMTRIQLVRGKCTPGKSPTT